MRWIPVPLNILATVGRTGTENISRTVHILFLAWHRRQLVKRRAHDTPSFRNKSFDDAPPCGGTGMGKSRRGPECSRRDTALWSVFERTIGSHGALDRSG